MALTSDNCHKQNADHDGAYPDGQYVTPLEFCCRVGHET